eukprot:TRINITY_DN6601_c0_g4_i1.p1 TRINITY_DN6601_c0_g4~~TRINITY_DN6601_c0_g4_i1.p1  ORF type:complete len:263 (+),score=35.87 TRINITY_DN6601_c0_g4_i1:101-889(+)
MFEAIQKGFQNLINSFCGKSQSEGSQYKTTSSNWSANGNSNSYYYTSSSNYINPYNTSFQTASQSSNPYLASNLQVGPGVNNLVSPSTKTNDSTKSYVAAWDQGGSIQSPVLTSEKKFDTRSPEPEPLRTTSVHWKELYEEDEYSYGVTKAKDRYESLSEYVKIMRELIKEELEEEKKACEQQAEGGITLKIFSELSNPDDDGKRKYVYYGKFKFSFVSNPSLLENPGAKVEFSWPDISGKKYQLHGFICGFDTSKLNHFYL